jgi:hypothetical protein
MSLHNVCYENCSIKNEDSGASRTTWDVKVPHDNRFGASILTSFRLEQFERV